MAPLTCPVCAAPVQQGDLICINCGANLARREPPPQQYPPQQDQQPGPPQAQEQPPYPPQQPYQQQDQQPYPPQQHQGYPPQQDYQQRYSPQQQGQSPYPPQQDQPYPPQQGHNPYPPQDQNPYPPQQDQNPYPPQQGHQQYSPPQQPQQYSPPPQQQYPPPQQQGYGGGYGAPNAPHVQPPPREPTMTGGESTAAYTPFCPHCGAEIPDVGNPVCVQCLRPLHDQGGGGGAQQVSLFVQFSSGELQVSAGQELVLGRDPVHSPVAGTFTRFDNVSRRHATLGIDGGGQAWIRDERSTNGTFVNDRRLQPGEQTSLRDGDSLRLAADARGQVRLGR
jgi:hypothetical protein